MSLEMRATSTLVRSARRLAALAALAALVLLAGCSSATDETEGGIGGTLRLNFASWQPVATKDVLPAQRDAWLAQHPKQDQMVVSGDYFGTGASSFAALITKKDKQGRRVRLVVLKPTEGGRFETYILQTESPMDTMPVITTSHKNEYSVNLDGQNLNVPVEGVIYVRPDGRQKLFFWNVDRFTDIELGPATAAAGDSSRS
jgi:hypothetical protein